MCSYSVTGFVSHACANTGRFFLRTWGWGEPSSSGVRWRCTSFFCGLAGGVQENYTQTLGVSLKSWLLPSLSGIGQGLSESISPIAVWPEKLYFAKGYFSKGSDIARHFLREGSKEEKSLLWNYRFKEYAEHSF